MTVVRIRKFLRGSIVALVAMLFSLNLSASTGFDGTGGGADQGIQAVYGMGTGGTPNPKARWNGRCLTCHNSTAGGSGNRTAFGLVFVGANLAERVRNASQGNNANLDSDNDGFTNAAEMQGCSDPFNPQQTPANLNPVPSHCLSTQTTQAPLPTLPPSQQPGSSGGDQGRLSTGSGIGGGTLSGGCGGGGGGARASGELWLLMAMPMLSWTFLRRRK